MGLFSIFHTNISEAFRVSLNYLELIMHTRSFCKFPAPVKIVPFQIFVFLSLPSQ